MSGNLKTFRLALVALFAMFAFGVSAQTVKGTVKDATGEPVIGATVQEQGTKNVAVTDLDGNYSIKALRRQPAAVHLHRNEDADGGCQGQECCERNS